MPIKSIFLTLLALGAVAVLVFGPRTSAPAPPGCVVVRYWEHWSGREADAMKGIVQEFNDTVGRQKGIYVEFLSQSNINQKVLLAASAGVPPDIAGLWDQPLAQWAALDALEPLDELAAAYGIGEGFYKPVYWKGCHYNGRLVALLSTPNDVALLWNKQAFRDRAADLRAAGLDPDRAPRSLAELDAYGAVLNTFDAGGRMMTAGYLPTEPGWYLAQTPLWFGATLYDEASGRLTLDSAECLAAFEWIASYSRRLGRKTLEDFRAGLGTYDSAGNPFLTGQLIMQLQGPWVATVIDEYKPAMRSAEQWGAAPFPSVYTEGATDDDQRIDHAVTWCGFDALVIPRGARHKKEAFEFIAYVNRMEVMERLCRLHCKGTPLTAHSDTWYSTHPNPHIALFDRLALSPNAFTAPPLPIWPQVVDEIKATINRVWRLEETPQDAVTTLQTSLQARLDQFRARHPH